MAMQVIRVVQGNVQCQCFRGKGGNWVAVCEPLKIAVQAETWSDLMEDFGLTLDAILKDLLGSNELEKFLRDRGWQLSGTIPQRTENVRFDVPFIPAMTHSYGSQRELPQ